MAMEYEGKDDTHHLGQLKKWLSEKAANDRLFPQFGLLVGSKTSRFNIPPFLRVRGTEEKYECNVVCKLQNSLNDYIKSISRNGEVIRFEG